MQNIFYGKNSPLVIKIYIIPFGYNFILKWCITFIKNATLGKLCRYVMEEGLSDMFWPKKLITSFSGIFFRK